MNIYNNFRKADDFSIKAKTSKRSNRSSNEKLDKRYDEPTFLSFKLEFSPPSDNIIYNNINQGTSFNLMPHPLLNNITTNNSYSSIRYLDSINEPLRAEMLSRFINLLNILQTDYQWSFMSIDGIDDLLNPDTKRGSRLKKDTSITVNCVESLDRRMYHIFNLYRKIAWDDEYQRWILPDMMRYFTLNIYITDMRNFHAPYKITNDSYVRVDSVYEAKTENVKKTKSLWGAVKDDIGNVVDGIKNDILKLGKYNDGGTPIILKMIHDEIPVHVIKCRMCEFDISSYKTYSSLNVDKYDVQNFSFKIKIGNIEDAIYSKPLESTNFTNDMINGTGRLGEYDENRFDILYSYYKDLYDIAQNTSHDEGHISGTFFNMKEGTYESPIKSSSTEEWVKNNLYAKKNNLLSAWINNALDFGVGWTKDKVNSTLDSLSMKEFLPGISYNTITAAIASQDIVGIVGMTYKGFSNMIEGYSNEPTLDSIEIDNSFKQMLQNYASTDVSVDEKPIQDYVKDILLDDVKYNSMINSPQLAMLEEENGAQKYEKIIWDNFAKNETTTNKKGVISFVGLSTE